MSGNDAFVMVNEHGWRRGLANLMANEFGRWWKSSLWLVQSLIWVGIVGFLLAGIIWGGGDRAFDPAEGVMIYSLFGGIFPVIAIVIIMQDVLVGEKQEGTAAWILSKPVSRPAFILAKLAANTVGMLVTMVLFPGIAAFTLISIGSGQMLNPVNFLAGMGILAVIQFFFLTLVLMLGTLFNSRGPVIGLGLALAFGQQYLIGLAPQVLQYILPWYLAVPNNNSMDGSSIAAALILGNTPSSIVPVITILLESILFVVIAIWRFQKEEF